MSVIKFSSNAEEVRYFTEQLLEDGKVHSVQEIKEYVECHSSHSEDFTEGVYSGAIRSLVQNSKGKYAGVARGKYQLVEFGGESNEEMNLQDNVLQILEEFCDKLEEVCTVNIMNVQEKDLRVAQKTAELVRTLQKKKNEIEFMR